MLFIGLFEGAERVSLRYIATQINLQATSEDLLLLKLYRQLNHILAQNQNVVLKLSYFWKTFMITVQWSGSDGSRHSP